MRPLRREKFLLPKSVAAVLVFVFCLVSLAAADFPEEVLAAKRSISGRMVVSHIHFLASKYCRGREPGDIGMEVADQYITSVLNGAGLTPAGDFGSYFQQVKLKKVSLSDRIHLQVVEGSGGTPVIRDAVLDADYLPIIISGEREVTAPVVFAGYGITAPEHNYDDYKNLNVKGRIVLVLRHEPGENDDNSPFEGRTLSKYGTILSKILNAQKHGAVGILFVTGPLNHKDTSLDGAGFFSGTNWPSLQKKRKKNDEDFKYMTFRERWRIIGADFGVKIPAVLIDGALADELLGENQNLKDIQAGMDKNLKPNSFPLFDKKVSMQVYFNNEPVAAHNIVAKVEGSDPVLKDEIVIVGGHYDHLGKDNRGQVNFGADDNASGTSAVLELARAFQNMEVKPKRTIIFILFTAEEKGLLGARYYADHPLLPLEKTIAMFNLDMIGRNDISQLSMLGKYQYPKLFKIVDDVNKKSANFELNFNVEASVRNSDQFPFMRANVPVAFFISGLHDQYHTPRDTVDRIVTEKVEKVAQMVFLALWETANLPAGTTLK